jgi:hypothetical protein
MAQYRKKPVVIEAWQCGSALPMPQWLYDEMKDDGCISGYENSIGNLSSALIETLEGAMSANAGDWIIRGVANELYPCKDEIFQQTYEPFESGVGEDAAEAA